MEKPCISAKIIKRESISDEWGILEQNLFLLLKNDVILRVEDNKKKITPNDIEKQKKFSLMAFLPHIEKSEDQKFEVFSNIKCLDETTNNFNTQFVGKIEEINSSRNTIHVDIGIGSIIVDIHPFEITGFNRGDFVKINAHRIDLNAVYRDE
jgi:hypothetical protein